MRLLGVGRKRVTAAQLQRQLFAWNWIGFGIVVLGGFLLFSSAATTFLVNAAFIWKLTRFLPLALAWHIVVQAKTPSWGRAEETPVLAKLGGGLEICLWLSVAMAAVLIPAY